MSNVSERNIYLDGTYLQKHPDWHSEDSNWKVLNIWRILEKNNVTFNSCVEVGCGAGQILKYLSNRYQHSHFFGYDISPDVICFWDELRSENLSFVQSDFLSTNESCDLLLLIDVMEHVEDYIGFLRSLSSRATWFVFHIPLDMNVQGLLRDKHIRYREQIGHLHYFSKSSAVRTLEDIGYEIKDWFYTAVTQEAGFSKRTGKSAFLNIFRKAFFGLMPDLTVKVLGGYSLMVLARVAK